jgi:ferrochelatase
MKIVHNLLLPAFLLLMSYHPTLSATENTADKVGVFFGSYGDIDKEEEIRGLVTRTIRDKDMIPAPWLVRQFIAWQRWLTSNKEIKEEYHAIGGASHMRETSQRQADLVARKLEEKGLNAKGYTGFAFTFPFVAEGLAKAQRDGVNRLIVFYQGAQHSRVTSFIVFRDVQKYLKKHPEWKVKVTAVKSFSGDPRFIDLLTASIKERINSDFAEEPADNVCLFLPMHGNIMKWIEQGDPSYDQMMAVVEKLRQKFPENRVYYGFQNHDSYPTLKWTQPSVEIATKEVGRDRCENVIINGRISFTVDSLETLYDHAIGEKSDIEEAAREAGIEKRVVAEKMFNDEPQFTSYLAELGWEALQGKGDILPIERAPELKP